MQRNVLDNAHGRNDLAQIVAGVSGPRFFLDNSALRSGCCKLKN